MTALGVELTLPAAHLLRALYRGKAQDRVTAAIFGCASAPYRQAASGRPRFPSAMTPLTAYASLCRDDNPDAADALRHWLRLWVHEVVVAHELPER